MDNSNNQYNQNNGNVDLSKQNQQAQEQNPYGQQAYGQNAYGQSQGQNPYGQSQGQNAYGQSAYGQSQGQNTNQQYGQNGQGFNQYSNQPNLGDQLGAMAGGIVGVNAPDYMLWLILGIVQICAICCCNCTALITGIITVVMVVQANAAYKRGDNFNYQSKMKVAKIVCCIGFGLMVLGWVVSLITGAYEVLLDTVGYY